MRSNVAMIVVALALAGCDNPESAVEKDGGKAPVLCLRKDDKSSMYFCRDADRRTWVCTDKNNSSCVPIDRVKATLDGMLPERPPQP